MLITWRPGQTRVEEIYVENQGGLTDSYKVTFNLSDPDWTGSLDNDTFLDVPPGGRITFNFSLTAPEDAISGDWCEANITASSMTVNISETIRYKAWVMAIWDLQIRYDGEEPSNLTDDLQAQWILRVENTGDFDMEVELELEVTLDDRAAEGLMAELDRSALKLNKGELTNVTVTVTVTDLSLVRSHTEYRLTVRARERISRYEYAKEVISFMVPALFHASVEPEGGTWSLRPGQAHTVAFKITQETVDVRGTTWKVSHGQVPATWRVFIDGETVLLIGNDEGYINITVVAPRYAPADAHMILEVFLEPLEHPSMGLEMELEFVLPAFHDVRLSASVDDEFLTPPDRLIIVAEVENRGNVLEEVTLFCNVTYLEDECLSPSPMEPLSSSVGPYNTSSFILSYWSDRTPLAGEYRFALECACAGGAVLSHSLEVTVAKVLDLQVLALPREAVRVNPNADPVELPFYIKNAGNIELLLNQDTHSDLEDQGLVSEVPELTPGLPFQLGPGHLRFLTLRLSAGDGAPFGAGTVELRFQQEGSENIWRSTFEVIVVGPDLNLSVLWNPKIVERGSYVTLGTTVRNDGTGDSPMTLMTVLWGGDPEPMYDTPIPPLGPGQEAYIELTFLPKGRSGTYHLVVDREGAITEAGDAPNEVRFDLVAVAGEEVDGGPSLTGLVAAAALLAIVLLLAWREWQRRRTFLPFEME